MSSNADQRIEPQKVLGLTKGAEHNFFGPDARQRSRDRELKGETLLATFRPLSRNKFYAACRASVITHLVVDICL